MTLLDLKKEICVSLPDETLTKLAQIEDNIDKYLMLIYVEVDTGKRYECNGRIASSCINNGELIEISIRKEYFDKL